VKNRLYIIIRSYASFVTILPVISPNHRISEPAATIPLFLSREILFYFNGARNSADLEVLKNTTNT
jgi:hypothetical protein